MNSLNSIIIEGNIVHEPQLRAMPSGGSVCTFSIATDRFYKKETQIEKEVSFFEVVAWGKLAETIGGLAHKGRGVRVAGRLKQDRWDGQDGKPRSKVIIVAENVEMRPIGKTGEAAANTEEETVEEIGSPE
jgi:single-strand DNA-binding protein